MPAGPVAFNLLVLRSRDLNRARAFYRALGVEFTEHSHGRSPVHLANEADGRVFEIYPLTEKDVPTSSARIGFSVPSVDTAYQALLAVGGQPVSSPRNSPWGRRAVVADPDGHRVELTASVKSRGDQHHSSPEDLIPGSAISLGRDQAPMHGRSVEDHRRGEIARR